MRERTRDGREIVEFMVRVLRDEDAKTSDRIEAAAWLAERGFGKVIVAEEEEAPVAVIINGDPELGPGVYRNAIKHA